MGLLRGGGDWQSAAKAVLVWVNLGVLTGPLGRLGGTSSSGTLPSLRRMRRLLKPCRSRRGVLGLSRCRPFRRASQRRRLRRSSRRVVRVRSGGRYNRWRENLR
jgi:hypothetical protein